MKKLLFTLLLFAPICSMAQENLLGKPQQEVLAAMKAANHPHVQLGMSKMKLTKLTHYDEFKTGNGSSIICFYYNTKDATCYRVREVRGLALTDSVRQALDSTAVKVKKDAWTNKTGDVKITLTVYKKYNFLAVDRVPVNKRED